MRKEIKKFIAVITFIILCELFNTGFSNEKQSYTITYGTSTVSIDCIMNKDGILLLPLKDVTNLIGFEFEECGRCGKDEIYNKASEDIKGHMFVNWYKNTVTYSNDATIVFLDAKNEKVDGVTYTSAKLYAFLGLEINVEEKDKRIQVVKGEKEKQGLANQEKESTDTISETEHSMIYAYDPSCSSCKAITSLLRKMKKEEGIAVNEIDVSLKENQSLLKEYEKSFLVPEELRESYPILYWKGQYLYDSEITRENIELISNGKVYEHRFVSNSNVFNNTDNSNSYSDNSNNNTDVDKSYRKEVMVVYFYSTTCSACSKTFDYINRLMEDNPEMKLLKYNLYNSNNIELLKKYGKLYKVSVKKRGEIPAVFIGDQALIGEEQIVHDLDSIIANRDLNNSTLLLDGDSLRIKSSIKSGFAVFGAGLMNGFNPCSLSMFLFLLSLMMLEKNKILKIGLSFCFGKGIMFLLLGTIFYKVISLLDIGMVSFITKNLLIVLVVIFAVLNISDFFLAKKESYDKMVLQLPSKLKGMNHQIMRKTTTYINSKYLIVIMIALGMLLATGEFMCSGQIYLTSIIALIQGENDQLAIGYLFLYSVAFILPLIGLTLAIYYGKKVVVFSNLLIEKLPLIKVVNAMLFIIFGIYVVFH